MNTDYAIRMRPCCPVCGSNRVEYLHMEAFDSPAMQRYFYKQYGNRATVTKLTELMYELVKCYKCGMAYQKTIPSDIFMKEIYDEWIPPLARDALRQQHTLDSYRYLAEEVEFLVQYSKLPPHAIKVLDFGFGWAEWAKMAQAFGCEVSGSELSQERIAFGRSVGIEVVSLADLVARRFHFINTEQVFEHLSEPLPVLRQLERALEPDGLLKISVPNSRVALRKVTTTRDFGVLTAGEIMPIAPLEHINCFEHDSLVALAVNAGLRYVRPSFRQLYNGASGWFNPTRAARLLARPWFRYVYPKSTCLYFVKER